MTTDQREQIKAWQREIQAKLEAQGYPQNYVRIDGLSFGEDFADGDSPDDIVNRIVRNDPTMAMWANHTLLLRAIRDLLEQRK